jgi:hypothetical protein
MSVGTYALVSLEDAKSALGGVPSVDGLWIYCDAAGATAATAQVSATALTLIITGGGSAGTNALTFASASNDTLSELITAINALAGWKAGAIYNGSAASTDLVVTGAQSCLGSANELTLKIEDNYRIEKLIDRATDIIEQYMSRRFKTRTYDRQVYDGVVGHQLLLHEYPATRIGRVSIGNIGAFSITNTTATNFATVEVTATQVRLNSDGTVTDLTISSYATINLLIAAINATSGWSAVLINTDAGARKATYTSLDGSTKVPEILQIQAEYCKSPTVAYVYVPTNDKADAYLLGGTSEDRNAGVLYSPCGWGYDRLYVDYIAGYTTIPSALESLCLEMVKMKYDRGKKDTTVQSEKIGDVYQYSLGDLKQVSDDILQEASSFRRLVL